MNVKYAVLWKDEDESEITIRYSTAYTVDVIVEDSEGTAISGATVVSRQITLNSL
jgi:hypothetical protein